MTTPKRKPGRPPGTGPGRKYTTRLVAHLTPEQMESVKLDAKTAGLSVSSYVKWRLLLET